MTQSPLPSSTSATEHAAPRETGPILVFGGTFDPPHARHVALLQGAIALLHARQALVIPAWANPQRPDGPRASQADRVAMCTLAFKHLPQTSILTLEIDRGRPCFTVETLETLHQQQAQGALPPGMFRLLIGSDQALQFRSWKDWERLLTLAEPAVVLRPPHERWEWEQLLAQTWDPGWAKRWLDWTLPIDPVDISSTAIRHMVEASVPLGDMAPPGIEEYVRDRGLYGALPQSNPEQPSPPGPPPPPPDDIAPFAEEEDEEETDGVEE